MEKVIFEKVVPVSDWNWQRRNYMGRINVCSTKLGKYVNKKVKIIVLEVE